VAATETFGAQQVSGQFRLAPVLTHSRWE